MNLISSKQFIGEIIEDLNLQGADYVDSFFRWIETAIGQIGLANYYPFKSKVLDIENNRSLLPCDYQFVHSVWIGGCSCSGGLGYMNLTGSPFIGNSLVNRVSSGNKGNIEGRYLYTDIQKGKVLLIYRALPQDEEGYPMIPNNAFLKEALLFYIIYRLALKGVTHPIIKMGDALNRWETLYPRASNDIDWMTLPELEEFSRMWSKMLGGNLVDTLYTT